MFSKIFRLYNIFRLKRLLNDRDHLKAIEAFDYFKSLLKKGVLSKEDIDTYKPIVYQQYLIALYSTCNDTLATKSFELNSKTLNAIRILVMSEPEVFGLAKKEIDSFLNEVAVDIRKHQNIKLEDMRSFSEKYSNECRKVFVNEKAAATMDILVDTFLLDAVVNKLAEKI